MLLGVLFGLLVALAPGDSGASGAPQSNQEGAQVAEGLSEAEAAALAKKLWTERATALAAELQDEDEAEAFEIGDHRLRVKEVRQGNKPFGERSLWISLHGGGRARTSVNDSKWADQVRLYRPTEGIYVAPRAPSDTWNLWHEDHVDGLLDRMIASYVVRHGVDPNRVYLIGYAAGGDGAYQLGRRMADRFAAAAAMAGHPNDAGPEGLRNLPFAVYVGAEDKAYDRNLVARQWADKLEALRAADPKGYAHRVRILPGKGHWMDGDEKEALPWMADFVRDPWPARVVWVQDDRRTARSYWLALVDPADARRGTRIAAEVEGNTIRITEALRLDRVRLRLSDALLDLDAPVVVEWQGKEVFRGDVPRTRAAIERSLSERPDPGTLATAELVVEQP